MCNIIINNIAVDSPDHFPRERCGLGMSLCNNYMPQHSISLHVGCQTAGHSTDNISTTTSTGSGSTSTDLGSQNQIGENSIIYAGNLFSFDHWYSFTIIVCSHFLAIGIPVGAVVIVGAFTVVIILWICRIRYC